MKLPSREELKHWWTVARGFPMWTHEFWAGLFHDVFEDGYLPRWLLRLIGWQAVIRLTRNDGEPYPDYIERLSLSRVALKVKLADLAHNMHRNGGPPRVELGERYQRARRYLQSCQGLGLGCYYSRQALDKGRRLIVWRANGQVLIVHKHEGQVYINLNGDFLRFESFWETYGGEFASHGWEELRVGRYRDHHGTQMWNTAGHLTIVDEEGNLV